MSRLNLRALASFQDYPDAELKLLVSVVAAQEFAKGAVMCREGAPGRSCFVLATGSVDVVKTTNAGPRTVATLHAGAVVGQMALVDRSPRSATVVAAEPVVALELSRDVFEKLLAAASPLALRFQEQIAVAGIRQLRAATDRLATVLGEESATSAPLPPPSQAERHSLYGLQAALKMWDMSVEDLDKVQVVVPAGQMTQTELKARVQGKR